MIPIVIKPIPEDDGTYCTSKRYAWIAECDADYLEWEAVTLPAGVTIDDIKQTAPNGLINLITVPVAGNYCFKVNCCKKQ